MSKADSFGALLRHLREQAGLTQEELAERAGLTAKGVSALERGERKRPYPQTVRALAGALEVSEQDRRALHTLGAGTARARPRPRSSVPQPTTELVGRDQDLATLTRLLREARLVTLTGPGGVGKSRLALEAAHQVERTFRDGVTLVPLATLTDPGHIIPAIATAHGIRQASPSYPLLQSLLSFLKDRDLLLVLDNFEHLVAGAPELARLLAASPSLRLLVTSRSPLHLRGEHQLPVRPLATPGRGQEDVGAVARASAAQLFAQRAAQAEPAFRLEGGNAATVAEICRRLDGLPLAIELAAARVKLLGAEGLLARLDPVLPMLTGGGPDLPDRHQALRRTIDWSYQLLTEDERAAFRRLSVFTGGWDLEALAAVCELEPGRLVDVLASLLDKSLVTRRLDIDQGPALREPRFDTLATIQAYGLEQLEASGEMAATRRRHAGHYAALAARAAPELKGPDQVEWLATLSADHENVQAALGALIDRGELETAVEMGWNLWLFWYVRGLNDGHDWIEPVLAQRGRLPHAAQAKVLYIVSSVLYPRYDDVAGALLDTCIGLAERAGDEESLQLALVMRGMVAIFRHQDEKARAVLDRSLDGSRTRGDGWTEAFALRAYAYMALERGDLGEAAIHLAEGEAILRRMRSVWALAVAVGIRGLLMQRQGSHDEAAAALRESVSLLWAVGDPWSLAHSLTGLAGDAAERGMWERAALLFGAAEELRSRTGSDILSFHIPLYDRQIAVLDREIGTERLAEAWAQGRGLEPAEAVSIALRAEAEGARR